MRSKQKSVEKNAFLNIIKQCCNIIFPLLSYPYVTRILGEESLGKFSFVDSIVSYFMILATLGIPTYAVREGARIRDDNDKIEQFSSEIFSINIITTLFSCFLMGGVILLQPRLQQETVLFLILGINIITYTLSRDWINNVFEDFYYITIRYIVFQIISLVLIFATVHCSEDYIKYTFIMMISNSGAYLSSIFYTMKKVRLKVTIKLNLKKHLKPILLLFCSTLAIQIYVKSDITVLGYLRTNSEVGIYTAASKVYTIIKALLNAIIMVSIPRLSYYLGKKDYDSYNSLLKGLKECLITFIIPSIVGVFCMSKEIIILVGGEKYKSGSLPLSILCLAMIFAVMGCYYAQGILIVNRDERTFTVATILSAILNIVLNICLIPTLGMCGAAITTVFAEVLICIICGVKSLKYYDYKKPIVFFSVCIGSIGIICICFYMKRIIENLLLRVILAITISVIYYIAVIFIFKNPCVKTIIKFIKK